MKANVGITGAASVLLSVIVTVGSAAWSQAGSEPPVSVVQAGGAGASPAPGFAATAPSKAPGRSGYYFRGALSFEWPEPAEFRDEDCSSASPAALYGCGTGNDGAPLHSVVDSGTTVGMDVGFGRTVGSLLRLEAFLQYRPGVSLEGEANFVQTRQQQDVTVKLSAYSAMLAAYLDLPRQALGFGVPFVGGGIGLSRLDINETRMTFTRTSTLVPGGQRTNFAWMVAAGVGIPVAERVTLDVAWRYTDYGVARTAAGTGAIVWHDGSREPLELDLAPTRGRLRAHGFTAGLRFAF